MSATPRTFLKSSTMNPCTLRRDWVWENRPIWMCKECGEVRQGTNGVDLHIQESRPDDTPLNMVSGCGVGVIQTEFLELLRAEAIGFEASIKIGRVFGPGGTLVDGWKSFHGDPRVIVRGEVRAGYRVCPECGRCHYFAQGRHYLCPPPAEATQVQYAALGAIVVSERVRNRVLTRPWRMLEAERLPVLDQPLDGFPRYFVC